MPDNLQRYGFRPATGKYSSEEKLIECFVATTYQAASGAVNVPLRVGDPVSRAADGSVVLTAAGSGTDIYGVIAGIVQVYDASLGTTRPSINVPGGTAWTGFQNRTKVLVAPVLGRYFEVDCDDAVTATTEAAYHALRGQNADHAFSPVVSVGAFPRLDINTQNTTAALQWNIVDVSRSGDNQFFDGNYVKLIVQANQVDDAGLPTATGI